MLVLDKYFPDLLKPNDTTENVWEVRYYLIRKVFKSQIIILAVSSDVLLQADAAILSWVANEIIS